MFRLVHLNKLMNICSNIRMISSIKMCGVSLHDLSIARIPQLLLGIYILVTIFIFMMEKHRFSRFTTRYSSNPLYSANNGKIVHFNNKIGSRSITTFQYAICFIHELKLKLKLKYCSFK